MDKDKLKESFHSLFNKINNILTAAGSNRVLSQGEDINKFSVEELKERISELSEALEMIERNATLLNDRLREIYEILKKEADASVPDSLSPGS